jgi:hypothetical protein
MKEMAVRNVAERKAGIVRPLAHARPRGRAASSHLSARLWDKIAAAQNLGGVWVQRAGGQRRTRFRRSQRPAALRSVL